MWNIIIHENNKFHVLFITSPTSTYKHINENKHAGIKYHRKFDHIEVI